MNRSAGSACTDTMAALVDLCLRGGKRMRAALVVAGARSVSARPPTQALLKVGAALELLHVYFLVHDDWMDQDLLRRGGPSVHAMLRRRFADPHRGDATAILAGDWAMAVATEWFVEAAPPTLLTPMLARFTALQRTAVLGQVRDLTAEDDDAELTYCLKTASYSVVGPLLLGGILAGASAAQLATLQAYGMPLGVAFQLRDDLIGVFGNVRETGKPVGNDLKVGKATALSHAGFELAKGADARTLTRAFGNPKASTREVRAATQVLKRIGASTRIEARILQLYEQSLSTLSDCPLLDSGCRLLTDAAVTLLERTG